MVYWDADARKDLLIGLSDGKVRLFTNIGTDDDPTFDGGTLLEVGPAGSKVNIDVGSRATPKVVDWNADGRKDLVIGCMSGTLRVFLNEGTHTDPDFLAATYVQENGGNLVVPGGRSSPAIVDVDRDGKKDLLAGNTAGQLLYYRNLRTDAAPAFSGYSQVEADGVPIDLVPTRSRPSVCDWTGDGLYDVLIGASDGKVHLYQGVLRIESFCLGDGSVLPCPCGNESPLGSGEGCENSTGAGALLTFSGTNLIAEDDLVLHVTQAPPSMFAVFVQGGTLASAPFVDGVLCLGAPLWRLETVTLDGAGQGSTTVPLASTGGVLPGQRVYYQAWYRDPSGPCAQGGNVSGGLAVDWR